MTTLDLSPALGVGNNYKMLHSSARGQETNRMSAHSSSPRGCTSHPDTQDHRNPWELEGAARFAILAFVRRLSRDLMMRRCELGLNDEGKGFVCRAWLRECMTQGLTTTLLMDDNEHGPANLDINPDTECRVTWDDPIRSQAGDHQRTELVMVLGQLLRSAENQPCASAGARSVVTEWVSVVSKACGGRGELGYETKSGSWFFFFTRNRRPVCLVSRRVQ